MLKNGNTQKNNNNSEDRSVSPDRWTAIVLAAGKGTRMNSPLPKVLHPVAGRPMLVRVLEQLKRQPFAEIRVVTGFGYHLVEAVIGALGVVSYRQSEQKGTGHAVSVARPEQLDGDVLILNGDHPLIESEDIASIMSRFEKSHWDLAVVTAEVTHPGSLGRIVRHLGQIKAIVEAQDASAQTLQIKEVNTGIYCVKAQVLKELLPLISNQNTKGEYYLTEIVTLALEKGLKVGTLESHSRVAFGVNTQSELAQASQILFDQKARSLMDSGVLLLNPNSVYIEETVTIEPGTAIYPNVMIRGRTRIASFCSIEPNCFIVDSEIERGVHIKAGSYLERVKIMKEAQIGPYARLRPETVIGEQAQVGNFVEMKKVKFGSQSKANHLTYLGDAEVGIGVNIGCGTITCNYAVDRKKYKTVIGDHVFVGSDTQFVAPVTIGEHAVIGSGSTITKDVPPWALAVARAHQIHREDWAKKLVKNTSESDSSDGDKLPPKEKNTEPSKETR